MDEAKGSLKEFGSGEREVKPNRKKTVQFAQVNKQWSYLILVPVLAVTCSVT